MRELSQEQKKITEALAKVETKAEAAAAPATGETPSTEAKPEEKKAEEPEMSDEQLSMLKAAFDDIDTNGSKYIEAAELKTAARHEHRTSWLLVFVCLDAEICKLFSGAGQNEGGTV